VSGRHDASVVVVIEVKDIAVRRDKICPMIFEAYVAVATQSEDIVYVPVPV
jgi:hypothetical protein